MTDVTTTKPIDELVQEMINKIVSPTIPVDISIGEAGQLRRFAMEDKIALLAKGLTVDKIENLNARAMYLREKQSIWISVYESAQSNTDAWEQMFEEASLLQKELRYDFQFAYRDEPKILTKLNNILDGNGKMDLMQDLSDYPDFALKYPEPLLLINFDNNKLDRASLLSRELYGLWQKIDGAQNSTNRPEKILRDRAYTYLKLLVDEIRAYGKYAFWYDDEKQERYASDYARRKNNKKKNKEEIGN
ncbi:hypothetical protein [Labilibaculum antarcticum]|uniref:Uncharacterized protein n=1 Tax=Labilibaculum antarcticum TaxID=1717717 RepID=A0A1Y1CM25_9BACT|nr:hypothetical protein [Labilibaculum antarcticum]BAX81478.1 hypothetical protein ALGA_3178 [Labilibaculum antarcticum]